MRHGDEQSPFVYWDDYVADPEMWDGLTTDMATYLAWEEAHCECGNCTYPLRGCKDFTGWEKLRHRLRRFWYNHVRV